ncbi:hypothetical protein GCM10010319_60790 [Streptomyces blastmyceticus]|uniref:Uncharacterized protein n=2 Tax=Streptomyces blastmyceticus TaxID=68180 RepID=A0ABP3HNJ3_9ACTN
MIVRCVANKGSEIGPYRQGLFYTPETRYDLSIDSSYKVFAMALLNGFLTVLVADDYDKPAWLPLQLFEVEDSSLPGHWEFAAGEAGMPSPESGELICGGRWGYSEVVHSDTHYYDLEERDSEALRVFNEERSRSSRG